MEWTAKVALLLALVFGKQHRPSNKDRKLCDYWYHNKTRPIWKLSEITVLISYSLCYNQYIYCRVRWCDMIVTSRAHLII